MMADKKEVMSAIKKLMGYEYNGEKPIIVIGPKLGSSASPDRHLRVYAYGGCIGEIPAADSRCQFLLADEKYADFLDGKEKEELLSIMESGDKKAAICSGRYLELILKASDRKFIKKSNEPQERKIENRILRRFMNDPALSWAAADMEFTVGTDSGKHDIVFYDASDKPSYIITELKYNCDSTDNIGKHIEDMKKIYSVKEKVLQELNRRMKYLCEYGLVNESFKNADEIKFAVLYVGGGYDNAKKDVISGGKTAFKKLDSSIKKNFYFEYAETANDIDIEKMKKTLLSELFEK